MRRLGQVIGVKPERIGDYEALHAAVWSQVLDLLHRHNVRNYSIFRDGETLFAYFEYFGDDFDADMEAMAADSVNQEWWALTEPMQEPRADRAQGEWWKTLPEVFHLD